MSQNIKNTLFRFVSMRAPELLDETNQQEGFIYREDSAAKGIFDTAVSNLTGGTTKWQAMKEAANTNLKGVLGYEEEPLVSVDFMGNPNSSIFDSLLTNVIGNQAKVVSWYDNEVGFSCRVVDLANFIGSKF